MELLRGTVLFYTFVVGVLTRNSVPTVGSRFSYSYSTSTSTFLQGRADQRSGIALECTAVVEVLANCNQVLKLQGVRIKATFSSEVKLLNEHDRLRELLERYPLWFCFRNGKVLKIFPQKTESTWALNIKRGILSALQTLSLPVTANNSVEEVDVSGKCLTQYQQKGSLLLKTKDFTLCSHHFSGFTSLRSVAVPNALEQFLSSRLECTQRFEEKAILAEVRCNESHLVTLPARKGSEVKMQTQTSLELLYTKANMVAQEKVATSDIYESNLLYEREKMPLLSTEEEVKEVTDVLQKLCIRPAVDTESTDLFLDLVFRLRQLSVAALRSLWQRPSSKCQSNGKPLLDALPSCATEACVVLMKELVISEEVEEGRIEHFLWSLAFIPEPTTGMIDALAPLLQLTPKRQSAFLGLTSLLHHFCSMTTGCDQDPAVGSILKILERYLGRKCTVQKAEEIAQMELILHAVGNAGLAATALTSLLSSCALLRNNPTEIRLAAIEAFRRIPCAANHAVLVRLFQAYNEDVEIRIASYLMAMKCPNEDLFNQIKWTLQEEKSSQVGSFVWSHLSEILRTEDPLKQHLRNSLPEDILSKEFDWERWKFSSYSDVTFHSAAGSGTAEAKIIFSPASFIPRSILANFTIHTLARAVNLLEVSVRLKNMEDAVRTFFDLHPVRDTQGRQTELEPPRETVKKIPLNKPPSSFRNDLPKESNSTSGTEEQRCPGGQDNKIREFEKKFTKRMGKKKPKCKLTIKVFGNELAILDCGDLRSQAKHYYLNMAEFMVKLLKDQEVQWNKRLNLAGEELVFPTISGLPVLLSLNASAAINLTVKGNKNFKQHHTFFISGYLKPSIVLQISARMGTIGILGETGLKWTTGLRSTTNLDGGIQMIKGKEFKFFWNTPEEAMEIIHFSSKLYVIALDKTKPVERFPGQVETRWCTSVEASKTFGWQLCSDVSFPDEKTSSFIFPFPGPAKVAIMLKKQDKGLQQYLIRAAYNYIVQKGSWIPNEARFIFFMGTPKSKLKRDVALEFHWNILQKTFKIEFIQPQAKVQLNGKIESSRYSRIWHLELVLDDNSIYYIKGRTNLQTVSGEQRYFIRLEAKLLKHGSPIVLAGNITKQPGLTIAFSISLAHLLKDTAFFSVCMEKKADTKLTQYSLEGETHIPGILGSHVIILLQQEGHFWSNVVKIKYGWLGDAKNLLHKCDMAQKLKLESGLQDAYKMGLEHEFCCTQSLTYNHKIHLHHEETASELRSQLEVNYGKHWDETNNQRKLILSQTFKNHSQATLSSYFMEFAIQVPERNVDYRTQLQHLHSFQGYLGSRTSFKVHYNNRIPFVAELQWEDASQLSLKKWEGTFNMDTPWLYLYAAPKLHQLQPSSYAASVELTLGKAFTVKGLELQVYYRDGGDEREGRIQIRTPTATYLRASTVNRFMKGFLQSQNEITSLWGHLIKNEVLLESNKQTKLLHFSLKSAKKGFNLTAVYCHLEAPRKSNISTSVLWTDRKSPPLILQLEAHVEEVRKEKMFYQKRGSIQFRHPLKFPIPQSFLLQETFTVNKKEKLYSLETKAVIDGQEESIQTLTLGYPAENPYICAGLTHPYNSKLFPKNIEACITMRNLTHTNRELEVKFKVNQKEELSFLGKYQNQSSVVHSHHEVQLDLTHVFQFTARLHGSDSGFELGSQLLQQKWSDFPQSLQAHVSANLRDQNGSFSLHTDGQVLVLLEASFDSEIRKNFQVIQLSIALQQEILTWFKYLELNILGKVTPSRLLLSSSGNLNQHSFQVGISGSKEHKAVLVVTLHGYMRHNLNALNHTVPQDLSLNGSLKHSINLNEGFVSVTVNRLVFAAHVRSRSICGNEGVHNFIAAVAQNGSKIFSVQGKLKGSPEAKQGIQRAEGSIQRDARRWCVNLANISLQKQIGFTGTLTHNINYFYAAGLPMESSIRTTYGHDDINQTLELAVQGGNQKISTVFEVEKLPSEALQTQFTAIINHSFAELKRQGLAFRVHCTCYYQNYSKKLAVGGRIQAEEEELRLDLENESSNRTVRFFFQLHHNVELLLRLIPPGIQVWCDGESTSHQLSGQCSGELTNHSLKNTALPQYLISGGSFFINTYNGNLTAFFQCNGAAADLQLEIGKHIVRGTLNHSFSHLQHLGLPHQNLIFLTMANSSSLEGLLLFQVGSCKVDVHAEIQPGAKMEWTLETEMDCKALEDFAIPSHSQLTGSLQKDGCHVEFLSILQVEKQRAHFTVRTTCRPKFTLEAELRHGLPFFSRIPKENKLSVHCGEQLRRAISLELKSGPCRLQANLDVDEENQFKGHAVMENNCKVIQDFGFPSKMNGSGHILTDNSSLDFQVALSAGENTFSGLLVLKGMATRQELHACLDQRIKGVINSGIPARMVVDLIYEKKGALCKRLLQFSVDGKQASVILLDVKNLTTKVQYGSYWITVEGQMQTTEGKLDLTGRFHHKWPWLFQFNIPASVGLTFLEILSKNETEASLNLTCETNRCLSFILAAKKNWESEELHLKSFQNLLHYLPNTVEASSEENYASQEIQGKLVVKMGKKDIFMLAKSMFTENNHTQLLLTHSLSQLTILPGHLVVTAAYQRSKQMQGLKCSVLWDGKEIKAIFNYTGLFPKVSRNHDLNVEVCHPFLSLFPPCPSLNVKVQHSLRSHQDRVIISWDTKEQVFISSCLKLGRERVSYSATVAHPFNFTVKRVEANSLTKGCKGVYTQQMQLAWNHGKPTQIKLAFGDKSRANDTFWDACITASSGQLQNIITVSNLQACGSLKQTAAMLSQHLDLAWDGKTVAQNLIYERSKMFHRDKILVQAVFKNLFRASCSHQHILGKAETDYSARLNYNVSLSVCSLPNRVAHSGSLQLNQGDAIFRSEGKVSLGGNEGAMTVTLWNGSKAERKNYSAEISLKGSEAVWMDVKACVTSSLDQSQIWAEGKMDQPNEKVKIAAFKGKRCLRYYMGYLKGKSEDGLELTACMEGRTHTILSSYLIAHGQSEEMGHLSLEASNQSLNLKARGCWDLVMKTESKLSEVASDLQHRLMKKIKNLEEHIQDFRKSIQHAEFLYDAVGWLLKTSREVGGCLRTGMKAVVHMWEQSGLQHALQDRLPLYLGKLQDILQQVQLELQKPLTTLKDAYYDVTLKPLDEVWQQKTEGYLKKLQEMVPTVVKDAWLMQPIQIALRSLKTGFDVAIHHTFNWVEARLSRILGPFQKPLSKLYNFSARNCSVAISLPLMSKGEPTLDLVNMTSYIIEEKLMKPLRRLYSMNLVAEYYKLKRAVMESPFEHHAVLMGMKHLWTFDGKTYSLASNCSILLAKDFAHGAFTIVLNQRSDAGRSLYLDMNDTALIIYPEEKIYKWYNTSLLGENCQSFDIPLHEDGITVQVETKHLRVTAANGAFVFCDLCYDFCTLTLDGWHHAASAGLFGTNDNEAGNEWMLPDQSQARSLSEFTRAWQVNNHCSQGKRNDRPCLHGQNSTICKTFFEDSNSPFKNCFGIVNPEPFNHWCKTDTCEQHSVKAACNLAAAFVHLCSRNFVPLEMPLQCEMAN